MDQEAIKQFWLDRPADNFLWINLTEYNKKIIAPFLDPSFDVLDLGAGDCRLSLAIANDVQSITAVDRIPAVEVCHPKIKSVIGDITDFSDSRKYNVILLFGVLNFIEDADVVPLYSACRGMLKDNGVLLVKHQAGRENDVEIDTYSERLGTRYCAKYRHYLMDIKMLNQAGLIVDVVDPYPPELNKWDDTFFKLFIGRARDTTF